MTDGGKCDPRFAAVREAFERNFAERGEVGASVCVTLDGNTVVDLWGGIADPAVGRAWERDTIGVVWSCTKGATALCAHMLVSRGDLDLDAPVASYWPEFAANGKAAITVRMLLAHQAGLAGFTEPIPDDGYCDWDLIARPARGPGAAVGAGHAARLPRAHVRPSRRRTGAARHRPNHRHVLPRGGRANRSASTSGSGCRTSTRRGWRRRCRPRSRSRATRSRASTASR